MKKNLFKYLPSEISINIFSRLPVRSIARSKCVCKPWLDLLSTDDFVDSHLSKSVPSLAISIIGRVRHGVRVFEFEDEIDDVESHDFRSNQLTKFEFPQKAVILGAADGLLLLGKVGKVGSRIIAFYICNPITREYVHLFRKPTPVTSYGFGVSRISRQHKVIWINKKSECSVYTVETGSWRRFAVEAAHTLRLACVNFSRSAFVDGHLYWRVRFSDSPLIACFDFETECFSSFYAPAASCWDLSVVKDCLCFCECNEDENVLWLMKDKSWIKEYVIQKPDPNRGYYYPHPINVFKNGDILMLYNKRHFLLSYDSDKTKVIEEMGNQELTNYKVSTVSFRSLKGLGLKKVRSF